jgi:hypothetical protein
MRSRLTDQASQEFPELAPECLALAFDEFLLQRPCEIELPADLDDAAFIEEAYRAILLREPVAVEREQYLRLLRNGSMSRDWIIEDLLASVELHSLERRLRVVCGGRVITEPETSGREEMPAVTAGQLSHAGARERGWVGTWNRRFRASEDGQNGPLTMLRRHLRRRSRMPGSTLNTISPQLIKVSTPAPIPQKGERGLKEGDGTLAAQARFFARAIGIIIKPPQPMTLEIGYRRHSRGG